MNPLKMMEIGGTGLMVSRLGLGGSSLGGMYRESSYREAAEVVFKFAQLGLNYIDTAPSYGFGLSEERIGKALKEAPAGKFVLSTKVGELLTRNGERGALSLFKGVGTRSKIWDFSRDGVLRSVESSLCRLQVDHIDILYIHDPYRERTDQAISEAFPALDELRASGAVKAIGVGMSNNAILSRFARECDVDCFLSFGTYSLLDSSALDELFPLCREKGISIILGAPFDSGILASDLKGDVKYHYRDAPPDILERARSIDAVCRRHGVPLKAAALQYVLRHPVVTATIPGTRSASRLLDNFRMIEHPVPEDMWRELTGAGLIREPCLPDPDPADR